MRGLPALLTCRATGALEDDGTDVLERAAVSSDPPPAEGVEGADPRTPPLPRAALASRDRRAFEAELAVGKMAVGAWGAYLVTEKIFSMPDTTSAKKRPYHHGDLRRALIDEALRAIAAEGPSALSLRELARRLGVSHAAPAHHFTDKAGLLTAVAAEGFGLLAAELGETYERTGSFLEVGVAYVRFATRHRPHFEVMFRPDLYRRNDPELVEANARARAMLYGPVGELTGEQDPDEVLGAGVAAWALVHGLATLHLNGNLPERLGDDPEAIARAVASQLFRGRQAPKRRR